LTRIRGAFLGSARFFSIVDPVKAEKISFNRMARAAPQHLVEICFRMNGLPFVLFSDFFFSSPS